jgi:hypothetical protein
MSHPWTVVLLLALLLGTLALAPTPPSRAEAHRAPAAPIQAPGLSNPELMGMVIRDPYYEFNSLPGTFGPNTVAQEQMAHNLAQIGVRWVRLEFLADGGALDFSKYDYFIGTLAPRYGLKVLLLLHTNIIPGSPYALNTEPTYTDPVYGGGATDYMRRWLDAALTIAAHYDGSSSSAGRVHAFEILNEINRLGDGTGLPPGVTYAGLDPTRVARLQAKFYRICKNTDGSQLLNGQPYARCPADTAIIVGGLHPKGTSARRDDPKQPETFLYKDEEYLEAMYRSAFTDFRNYAGNQDPWKNRWPTDGIGFHPYPEEITPREAIQDAFNDPLTRVLNRLNQVRMRLSTLPDANQAFWITEIGFNVGFYKVRGPTAPTLQADFMRAVYTSMAGRADVANVFWFKYEDFPPAAPQPGVDPQLWGVVSIPFVEGGSVNGLPCAGGACYDPSGAPNVFRPAYLTYRELAGLPIQRVYLPVGRKGT